MAFPYSYNKTLTFTLRKKYFDINTSYIQSVIFEKFKKNKKLKELKKIGNKISFKTFAPIFNFQYTAELDFAKHEDDLSVTYEVNLEKLLMIVLVITILTAFFSFVSVKYFLILAGLFALAIYGVFYLIIDNFIQVIVKKSIDAIIVSQDDTEKYTDEQMKWINDDTICSACGNELSDFDLYCKECGIKLKRNKYTIPLDVSKYKDKQVSYHIKKKK